MSTAAGRRWLLLAAALLLAGGRRGGWGGQAYAPAGLASKASVPRNAYVHLPFCRRRCFYCDFPIHVVGEGPGAAASAAEAYGGLLAREVAVVATAWQDRVRAAGGLETVYFGGGTPSLAPPAVVSAVLTQLAAAFGLAPGAEVTLEMDPGTFDKAALDAFLAAGVNRVSLGVQSFSDEVLQIAGRAHSAEVCPQQ